MYWNIIIYLNPSSNLKLAPIYIIIGVKAIVNKDVLN
jgi:hypothetical protein